MCLDVLLCNLAFSRSGRRNKIPEAIQLNASLGYQLPEWPLVIVKWVNSKCSRNLSVVVCKHSVSCISHQHHLLLEHFKEAKKKNLRSHTRASQSEHTISKGATSYSHDHLSQGHTSLEQNCQSVTLGQTPSVSGSVLEKRQKERKERGKKGTRKGNRRKSCIRRHKGNIDVNQKFLHAGVTGC